MWWLLNCNTGCLRKHKPSVLCSVLLSSNFVIVKACTKKTMGSTDLAYSKKVNLKFPVSLSFQGLPSFVDTEKSSKFSYFVTRCCFIHPPLIFASDSLIIYHYSILLSFSLASLAKVCEQSVVLNVRNDFLLIVRFILQRWSIKTIKMLILSSLGIKVVISTLQISKTLRYYLSPSYF